MTDPALTRRVGAIALAVLAAAIAFVVVIAPRIEWRDRLRIEVQFAGATGLREGAAVVVAGQAIGEVESIALRRGGGVTVRAALVTARIGALRSGGDVFVSSRGPVGERYLELGPAPIGGAPLRDGEVAIGRDPPSLDRVLQRTWDNLTTAREFGRAIRPELDALRARLGELATSLDSLAPDAALGAELRGLLADARALRDDALGGEPGLARVRGLVADTRATFARATGVLDQLAGRYQALARGGGTARDQLATRGPAAVRSIELTVDRLRAAIAKLDPLLATVDAIAARIARGEGSLLRLMRDPEFPEDAKELGKIMKRRPWRILARPIGG